MANIIICAENLGKRYKIRHVARKPCDSVLWMEYSVFKPGSRRPSLPWAVEIVGSPEIAAR